jgi:Na+-driven multidrug efflux pump
MKGRFIVRVLIEGVRKMAKKFFGYAIPSVIAMWLYSFYTMVDGFFVSRAVGPMALAAVNISMPYVNFIFGVSMLCSAGASVVVSIYLGRGEKPCARDAFMTNAAVLLAVSLVMTLASMLLTERISKALGATPALMEDVSGYLGTIFPFTVFFIMAYFLEVMARADGHPRLSAASVASAGITNIALDYLFVMKFGWGVKGAALATGIAQAVSVSLLAAHFIWGKTNLGFARFKPDLSFVIKGVGLGMGDFTTELSVGAVIFLFNNAILRVIGESGVASYTVMAYATTLVVMTMCGIAQGMVPLASYHHGRGDAPVCGGLLKIALLTSLACGAGWFVCMEAFTGTFVSAFISPVKDGELYAETVRSFRIYGVSFIFIGVNVTLASYFSSVEKPVYGVILSASRGIVVIAATLWAMARAFGAAGIWLSPTVSELICVGISFALFRLMKRANGTNGTNNVNSADGGVSAE